MYAHFLYAQCHGTKKSFDLDGFDIYVELPNSGGRVPLKLKRLPRDFIELLPPKVLSYLEAYVTRVLKSGPVKPHPAMNSFNGTGNVTYTTAKTYTPPVRVH